MSRGASVRLFTAVDPPPEVAGELSRWARSAARAGRDGDAPALRVLDPDSLHVTLLFLGERPAEEIDGLAAALSEAALDAGECHLETGAPLWLPPRRPRALAVEIHDSGGDLFELQRELARRLCEITGEQPPRRFRAHLTVARTRAAPRRHAELPATPPLRFGVTEAVLYRSRLEPSGARYEAVAQAPLGGL
jgi:RNA 2',3'-cyclic 3'-phosphodiesterase